MASDLHPLMADPAARRELIREKTISGIKDIFPIVGRNTILEVKNISVQSKDYSTNQQKDALMRGRTLHEPVHGTLVLKDKKTGKVVNQRSKHTLAHLPYFTERQTFVIGGNEYSIPSQLRLKSGVFTRERANGEYEAAFNLKKGLNGHNFRLSMEPESGKLHMELGTSKVPLYPLLRSLGVPDTDIQNHWGAKLKDVNASHYQGKEETTVNKVIGKIKRIKDVVPTTYEGRQRFLHEQFDDTEMDKAVNERTLGVAVGKANSLALLIASKKLIDVHKGNDTEDDRDSLEFKTIHSVDDFFNERLVKDAKRTIGRKLEHKLNQAKDREIKNIIPNSTFTKSLNTFITNSALSTIPMQINPVEIIDHAAKITSLGEGGISSDRAIPIESRKVHNTHYGIIDPVRTPEGAKTGIDIRASLAAYKDSVGNLYARVLNKKNGKFERVAATKLARSVIAFPGQENKPQVDAIQGTDVVSISRNKVDYELPDHSHAFGVTTALVPLLDGMQGNRAIMGAKFQSQALPLLGREAPLVQAQGPNTRTKLSMEKEVAKLITPVAPITGTVSKVDADYIYIRPDAKTAAAASVKVPYDTLFPLASKTYLHNNVKVKAGDRVKRDQTLTDSNFTKDDTLALGKNMKVAYMAYYGKNSNDAVVISSGAAKKLTSEHMYKEVLAKGSDVLLGKNKYQAYYGAQFTAAQLNKLDEQGIAKPGEKFQFGDPVILGLQKSSPTSNASVYGDFHKSLVKPYRDVAVTWDHMVEGEVVDALDAARQVMITVRTQEPMKIGDKLANRFGGKGVVSEIIGDEKMIQDEGGKPVDVLFTSAGVVSRINPGQIVEASLGKVAAKTGKPIVLPQFMKENNIEYTKKLMKEHGVKDKETVYDPMSEKKIKNVFVGNSYIHKLFKSTETNYSARGVSAYDVNLQPTKGGDEGAKGIGKMELNALLAHNARNNVKDMVTMKSEKSDDYWRAIEFGLPAPPPKTPFVTEKFVNMLRGSGVNVDKRGSYLGLSAMTDKDIDKLSSGAISLPNLEKSRSITLNAKNLKPEKGGLFDINLTGGREGTRWAHMDLVEPIVNPVFEEPVRRLLGLTKQQLKARIGKDGGKAIRTQLNDIDLKTKAKELKALTKTKRGADLDNAIKQLGYVRALQKEGHKDAGDVYTWSKVPIIPPVFRPVLPSAKGGELQISDANYLYRDVALASQALKGHKDETGLPDEIEKGRHNLYDSVSALVGMTEPTSPQLKGRQAKGFIRQITGVGSPKTGFIHKRILKRQQDLSGRGTATPDNTLNMDQIGIPDDMLWSMYGKFIMKGLIGQGYSALNARDMIENQAPAARAVLEKEVLKRPVFVNRAPSLHKHNVVAAFAVPVAGKSLRVNPFMEQGQNLDYDGDAMQLHVPVSDKAVDEAQKLTLSNLLFSDKNRDALMVFPQHEAILGTYLATAKTEKKAVKKFKNTTDAMQAYKAGTITANTPVKIG